jgi:hypothetical protein
MALPTRLNLVLNLVKLMQWLLVLCSRDVCVGAGRGGEEQDQTSALQGKGRHNDTQNPQHILPCIAFHAR